MCTFAVLWHNKISAEKPWFFVSIEKPWHFHGYFIVPKHHEKLAENSRIIFTGNVRKRKCFPPGPRLPSLPHGVTAP